MKKWFKDFINGKPRSEYDFDTFSVQKRAFMEKAKG